MWRANRCYGSWTAFEQVLANEWHGYPPIDPWPDDLLATEGAYATRLGSWTIWGNFKAAACEVCNMAADGYIVPVSHYYDQDADPVPDWAQHWQFLEGYLGKFGRHFFGIARDWFDSCGEIAQPTPSPRRTGARPTQFAPRPRRHRWQ